MCVRESAREVCFEEISKKQHLKDGSVLRNR
jgi:hypothetical protein